MVWFFPPAGKNRVYSGMSVEVDSGSHTHLHLQGVRAASQLLKAAFPSCTRTLESSPPPPPQDWLWARWGGGDREPWRASSLLLHLPQLLALSPFLAYISHDASGAPTRVSVSEPQWNRETGFHFTQSTKTSSILHPLQVEEERAMMGGLVSSE